MRAHAALLLLSEAITSALCMNYKSEANRNLLITRLPVLTIRDVPKIDPATALARLFSE